MASPSLLAAIDAVGWAHLAGAPGPSIGERDVAAALRTLATQLDDNDDRRDALDLVLWSHGRHQGTLYPVTAAIVPLLIALIEDDCDGGGELPRRSRTSPAAPAAATIQTARRCAPHCAGSTCSRRTTS